MKAPRPYQICARCIMDTTDPEIRFDANGCCNHCEAALERLRRQVLPPEKQEQARIALAEKIRRDGKHLDYDCIIGVSGGIDSTTTAYWVKKLGLRPLAVHFDNGWNSELAVHNIKKTLDVLGIELFTYVVDWEEFRDLQLCFLKASVANCEAPTDHGITATLFRTARRVGCRYVLSGSNVATEAIMPPAWGHYNQDLRHLKALHRRFGSIPLRTMPTISMGQYLRYVFVHGIRQIPFLNYVPYNKQEAKAVMARDLGWRAYPRKHGESIWTAYFQDYYLPFKFGYDKRRAHLSSLICSGQMTRDEALQEVTDLPYDPELLPRETQFVTKKLGLTPAEFEALLQAPPKSVRDYPSNEFLYRRLEFVWKAFRRIATSS